MTLFYPIFVVNILLVFSKFRVSSDGLLKIPFCYSSQINVYADHFGTVQPCLSLLILVIESSLANIFQPIIYIFPYHLHISHHNLESTCLCYHFHSWTIHHPTQNLPLLNVCFNPYINFRVIYMMQLLPCAFTTWTSFSMVSYCCSSEYKKSMYYVPFQIKTHIFLVNCSFFQ